MRKLYSALGTRRAVHRPDLRAVPGPESRRDAPPVSALQEVCRRRSLPEDARAQPRRPGGSGLTLASPACAGIEDFEFVELHSRRHADVLLEIFAKSKDCEQAF